MTTTPETKAPEKPAPPPPTDTKAEIKALGIAYEALAVLDYAAQCRALRWLSDRLEAEHRRTSATTTRSHRSND